MRSSSRSASGNTGGHCTAFVSGDLSQVIHFQCGLPSAGPAQQMWVNLGIRIPECDERTFPIATKRYYREYNCTLRSRLGSIDGRQELCFDLRKQPSQLLNQILPDVLTKYCRLRRAVLPEGDSRAPV